MSEVTDIDKKQTEELLRRYQESGQNSFNTALATPDTEAAQDAFNRFANDASAEVAQMPTPAGQVGHSAVSGAESAQVLQFPKR